LTHAAGNGPNSCWATHTGVQGATGYTEAQIEANPAAVGFTKHAGDLTIGKPNTTIDHEWITGCVKIADGADNTTIKNSLITPDGDACPGDNAGGSAINTGQGSNIATNTLVEDTTVDGGNQGYGSHTAGITVDAGEVLRVNLFGFTQGFISDANTAQNPALFQDDYGHGYIGCTHDDGTWFNSSSYVTFKLHHDGRPWRRPMHHRRADWRRRLRAAGSRRLRGQLRRGSRRRGHPCGLRQHQLRLYQQRTLEQQQGLRLRVRRQRRW
jgi:hypothetical protein